MAKGKIADLTNNNNNAWANYSVIYNELVTLQDIFHSE